MASVMRSSHVPVKLKVAACTCYSLPRLTYGIACPWRAASALMKQREAKVSYKELRDFTGMPTFLAIYHNRVLSLFRRVAASNNKLLFSAIALTRDISGSWLSCVVAALAWFRSVTPSLANVVEPSIATLDEWAA
eukprot:5039889-Amphidinium_carterae.1